MKNKIISLIYFSISIFCIICLIVGGLGGFLAFFKSDYLLAWDFALINITFLFIALITMIIAKTTYSNNGVSNNE